MIFASTILMVRPASFAFNAETATNNAFQQKASIHNVQQQVLAEFEAMVKAICSAGIEVIVIDDTPQPPKPDAIFPNNWFCTLPGGMLALFPMYAPNRRTERRQDIIDRLMHEYIVTELEDWSQHEQHQQYLESTGSMVMDHTNKIIYACISERTDALLLHRFGENTGYDVVPFHASDKNGMPIYHTNVLMCMGEGFCVACTDVIDKNDIGAFLQSLQKTGLQLIGIGYEQMMQFAGNMLQLHSKDDEPVMVLSRSAYDSLSIDQKEMMQRHTSLLPVNIDTIENIGGGSARYMMAEILLNNMT